MLQYQQFQSRGVYIYKYSVIIIFFHTVRTINKVFRQLWACTKQTRSKCQYTRVMLVYEYYNIVTTISSTSTITAAIHTHIYISIHYTFRSKYQSDTCVNHPIVFGTHTREPCSIVRCVIGIRGECLLKTPAVLTARVSLSNFHNDLYAYVIFYSFFYSPNTNENFKQIPS